MQKFLVVSKAARKPGMESMRVMTDVAGERFWTVVAEIEVEVESLEKFAEASRSMDVPEVQEAMKGYHDLVDHGRREIYTLES